MSDALTTTLHSRSGSKCELCGANGGLQGFHVGPGEDNAAERNILICETCGPRLAADLDATDWFCLKEAIWSEVPAVQVVGYRLLTRLQGETWVDDLLGQVYLDEAVIAWAQEELTETASADSSNSSNSAPTLDSNGTALADGDSVTLIKDLDVKGTTFVAKRGTLVKNIRLIPDDPDNVEGRVNKIALVLKTCFLKKS